MGAAHFLVANNAPMDWVYGFLASVVFVAAIAIPAAVLNARDHRRRQGARPHGGQGTAS
jgi:hypothetical protein